jgi:Fe-S cluster biosynthesis and repair protein YggX
MAKMITCLRTGKVVAQMEKPPIRGKIGQEIWENAGQEAWDEWARTEVMVINEYRLNLADPEHRQVLYGHMREFFNLPSKDDQ